MKKVPLFKLVLFCRASCSCAPATEPRLSTQHRNTSRFGDSVFNLMVGQECPTYVVVGLAPGLLSSFIFQVSPELVNVFRFHIADVATVFGDHTGWYVDVLAFRNDFLVAFQKLRQNFD